MTASQATAADLRPSTPLWAAGFVLLAGFLWSLQGLTIRLLEVATSEQFAASKLVQQLPSRPGEADGPKVVGLPITFDRVRPRSARPSPNLGEHTAEVLGR